MPGTPITTLTPEFERGLLADVPGHQRGQILAGMRWTVWLSALSLPFSYGITALLARTSPEAIGTYGLLSIYIGLATAFFYFGGDPVVIRFIPEIKPGQRIPFLIVYSVVIGAMSVPPALAAVLWPASLKYVLGSGSTRFHLLLIGLAPFYVGSSVVVAALKGVLEIGWAQALMRAVTVGSFAIYATLFVAAPVFLSAHHVVLVWGVYLLLVAAGGVVGLVILMLRGGSPRNWTRSDFVLPLGFWRYAASTQALGLVGFVLSRVDYLMIVNLGGLESLGKYFAIASFAMMIPTVNKFFVDTLLPSLTNMLTARNVAGAGEVFAIQMRVLFAVNTATCCGLILFSGPLTALLGPKYVPLRPVLVLMGTLVGLASPGAVGAALLAAVGKQHWGISIGLLQLTAFLFLMFYLWPKWQLAGVAAAEGGAMLISQLVLLAVARSSVPFVCHVSRDYAIFGVVATLSALLSTRELPLAVTVPAWLAAVGLYLGCARYSFKEMALMVQCFVPDGFGSGRFGLMRYVSR